MKIYIIEDDSVLRQELAEFLEGCGFQCEYSDNFANITELVLDSNPDLVLLDINLPYQDGYYICGEIRRQSKVPIIIVTSRSTDMDELMSMNLGADDFITKPYNTQILLARISSIFRRLKEYENERHFESNSMVFYPEKSMVEFNGENLELTKNERHILLLLFQRKGEVVSRNALMEELWQSDEFVDENTLTVNVNRLRRKLDSVGIEDLIKTRRGQGYIL